MINIDIISGFLGAGKTTLIKKLLKEVYNDEKVVLLENEFGEIGIDQVFLKSSGIAIKEINSGCICCSLVGDFEEALKQIADEFQPQRIIIEPSGVAKLSDIMEAILNISDEKFKIDHLITVIDAKKCKLYTKNFGEFFNNQIENAATIFLTRTEALQAEKIEECIEIIRHHNVQASITSTPLNELSKEILVKTINAQENLETTLLKEIHHHHEHHDHSTNHHHHHHHADEVFTSISIETVRLYTLKQLETILKTLTTDASYGHILRAKGVLKAESWLYFDVVYDEYQIREGETENIGKICVIGEQLNEEAIRQLFEVTL